jgi:hypothetical protein
MLDALGVVIVEGDRPASVHYAARLRGKVGARLIARSKRGYRFGAGLGFDVLDC